VATLLTFGQWLMAPLEPSDVGEIADTIRPPHQVSVSTSLTLRDRSGVGCPRGEGD